MTRPAVSVVMPFAGDRAGAQEAVSTLRTLRTSPEDELILVENSDPPPAVLEDHARGAPADDPRVRRADGVSVIRAEAERSPAHARNIGASHAGNEWILFLDADCRAPADLLDAYFRAEPVADDVGALAGEVHAAPGATTLAERYGAARSFLGQQSHFAHPYRPRAVAANLLVRRTAFEQVGGFYEGVRAAEDTDFSWRLQDAGWRLELRPGASVEHMYRASVRDLRRQWRGYAAGRAWLGRRYRGFEPEPALRRALTRGGLRPSSRRAARHPAVAPPSATAPARLERLRHLGLDAVLGVEELAGLLLSNRPSAEHPAPAAAQQDVQVVLVADRFPAPGDPLVDFARTLRQARVEALARPDVVAVEVARALRIDYREDDGVAARWLALGRLLLRHPVRVARARLRRGRGGGGLLALAPAAVRLDRDRHARLHALAGEQARRVAGRLAELTGRPLTDRGAS